MTSRRLRGILYKQMYDHAEGFVMGCRIHALGELGDYRFTVIFSKYQGKLLLSRHKKRTTWENQGGHIEAEEATMDCARRELYEESGAVDFDIVPAFDYWASDDAGWANGQVFIAHIRELGAIPESEMAEVRLFDELPEDVTYPGITPILWEEVRKNPAWEK
ncbi:MAG: NUDIX domain-containing protein [Ruminococcaceae bacterium]|nr:NUDIX domain-containing protein [Oscillospiraceae bacterium]